MTGALGPRLLKLVRGNSVRIALATALATGSSYAVSKVVAVQMGPTGIGLLGAIMGSISLIASLSNLGIPTALPAIQQASLNYEGAAVLLRRSLVVVGLAVPLASLLLLTMGFEKHLSNAGDFLWLSLAGFVAVALLITASLDSMYCGGAAAATTTMKSAVASTSASCLLLLLIPGITILTAIGLGSLASLTLLIHHWSSFLTRARQTRLKDSPTPRSPTHSWRMISRLSLGIWAGSIGANIAWGAFPVVTLIVIGSADSGQLKAALSLSMLVFYVGSSWVINVTYPALSKSVGDIRIAREVTVNARNRVLLLLVPAGIGLQIFSPWILQLLYSDQFSQATLLVGPLVVAAIIRTLTLLNVYSLSAQRTVRAQALTEWCFALSLAIATAIAALFHPSAIWFATGLAIASLVSLCTSEVLMRHHHLPSVLGQRGALRS